MGAENLCDAPGFTGYQIDGGHAELTVAEATYCFHLPESYDDVSVAPLLCAGLIGYRALRVTGQNCHQSKQLLLSRPQRSTADRLVRQAVLA